MFGNGNQGRVESGRPGLRLWLCFVLKRTAFSGVGCACGLVGAVCLSAACLCIHPPPHLLHVV